MSHSLIVGTTQSGKTRLSKKLAQTYINNGKGVLVYDPLKDEWPCDFITNDINALKEVALKNKSCAIFIDEAGTVCHQHAKEAFWFATMARHWGHNTHFISQRANQISPTIRDNCSNLFCFRVSPNDAKTLAEDFCHAELEKAYELAQGECYSVIRFKQFAKINTFENNT